MHDSRDVSVVRGTIEGLDREPADAAEMKPRKAALIGGFGRSLESIAGLLGRVGVLAEYGIPLSEIDRYTGRVEAVTSAEVLGFAKRYLASGETMVIVGNGAAFLNDLRKRFPGLEVIPYARLDLNRDLP